jgi:hypothetical protein
MLEVIVEAVKAAASEAAKEGALPQGDEIVWRDAALGEARLDPETAAMGKVVEAFEGRLRNLVDMARDAQEQLHNLPASFRYGADRERLTMATNGAIGGGAEVYLNAVLKRFGEVEAQWTAPNGKRPDFLQRVTDTVRLDRVVQPDGSLGSEVVRRGSEVVHEAKTSTNLAGAEWTRLQGQIEGTLDAMRAGTVDRMYIHVASDYPDLAHLAQRVEAVAQGAEIRVIADLPVETIRAAFNAHAFGGIE